MPKWTGKSGEERFWERVAIIPEHACWEWIAGKSGIGYGVIQVDKKLLLAHRFSYELHFGQIPKGLFVCHVCDNPSCVRPEHLFLGTPKDNMDDMRKKGRAKYTQPQNKTSCPKGHPYSGDNLYINKKNRFVCKICSKLSSDSFHAKRKAARPKPLLDPEHYCSNGHPRNEANLHFDVNGWKRCRVCEKENDKRYKSAYKFKANKAIRNKAKREKYHANKRIALIDA